MVVDKKRKMSFIVKMCMSIQMLVITGVLQ